VDKRLRIVLELITRGFSQGARSASGVFKGFVSGITSGALHAGRALVELARGVFFVREALNTLAQAGRWLFDTFIKGAGDAAKLEAKLKNVTGSADDATRVMDLLRQTAADTGADFDELAAGAGLMAVAAKDASGAFDFSKFQRLMNMLQRMAALRPDVPLDRLARGLSSAVQTGNWSSLEMFLDVNLRQLIGLKDAADEVAKVPDQIGQGVTFITTKTDEAAQDALKSLDLLDEALTKAGATAGLIEDVAELSGLERFQQILGQIADTVGEPIFEALNTELSKLADWLQENPEKVEAFASTIGEFLADNLQKAFDALEKIDWDKVADDMLLLAQSLKEGDWESAKTTLEGIAKAVQAIADALEAVNRAAEVWKQIKEIGQFAEENPEAFAEAVGKPGMGGVARTLRDINQQVEESDILQGLIRQGPSGAAAAVAQKIMLEVRVTSDDEKFNAHVKQISDGAVTDGMNSLAEELE